MSSSPIEAVDANYIVSEVSIERNSSPFHTILLVEGQDDEAVYKRFVDLDKCLIVICYGSPNLNGAIDLLNRYPGISGYLAIRDADFDPIDGYCVPDNVALTDGHDLETMIIGSGGLDLVLDTHFRGMDKEVVDAIKQAIKQHSINIGCVIGYVRYASLRRKWSISLNAREQLRRLRSDKSLDLRECLEALAARYPRVSFDESLVDEFETLASTQRLHLCVGHDLIAIITELLPRIADEIAARHARGMGGDLPDRLFLAFDLERFRTTQLYAMLLEWERNNTPWKVLQAS